MTIHKWSTNIENVLSNYQQQCCKYKWLHDEESRRIKHNNKWLNIVNIAITSVTATSTSITSSLSMNTSDLYIQIGNIVYPIALYLTAVINLLQQFFNYEKQAEKHCTFSLRFNALQNNIYRMLTLDIVDRNDISNYFEWVTREYDNMIFNNPSISTHTIKKYEKIFDTTYNDIKLYENDDNIVHNNDISNNNDINLDQNILSDTKKKQLQYELQRYASNCYVDN